MRSLVLSFILTALVSGQDDFQRIFNYADSNKDGFVSPTEYRVAYGISGSDGGQNVDLNTFLTNYRKVTGQSITEAMYRFFLMDGNSDGKITTTELDVSFTTLDANKDGKISFDEYKADSTSIKAQLDEALKEEPRLEEKFKQADQNGNRRLSQPELLLYIMRADKNIDGKASQAEFVEFWNDNLPAIASDRTKRFAAFLFKYLDSNNDGFYGDNVLEENAAFRGLDTDGNGEIDDNEYLNNMLFRYAGLVKQDATNGCMNYKQSSILSLIVSYSVINLFK